MKNVCISVKHNIYSTWPKSKHIDGLIQVSVLYMFYEKTIVWILIES